MAANQDLRQGFAIHHCEVTGPPERLVRRTLFCAEGSQYKLHRRASQRYTLSFSACILDMSVCLFELSFVSRRREKALLYPASVERALKQRQRSKTAIESVGLEVVEGFMQIDKQKRSKLSEACDLRRSKHADHSFSVKHSSSRAGDECSHNHELFRSPT